ncbi:hypothetical protein LG634_28765 [Streptomyces bambusae]|uniref:hypothetical protein n=1 Tax=Streptomyces bambusae TaxID=1550616 RepID=UPI001CFCA8F8|nr:hypothetical protein [Streptomyces bambusae]MCB5168802.1 hypothetical protein [Streptomyces bambusae]
MKRRNAWVRALAVATVAGALAWTVTTAGQPSHATATEPVADAGPGYAIEDYGYPNADRILAEQGILLKRGDGHITLADCASEPNLLRFLARGRADVCFKVTGTKGYLALELPSVHGVRTSDVTTTHLEMTAEDDRTTYDIPAKTWEGVGESTDGREHVLVEIRTTR